jgi:hypothetical protein
MLELRLQIDQGRGWETLAVRTRTPDRAEATRRELVLLRDAWQTSGYLGPGLYRIHATGPGPWPTKRSAISRLLSVRSPALGGW